MTPRRKDALKLLAIATPMLAYGALTFEIGGAASTAEAITKSIVTTLGLFGTVAGLLMFFTKTSLGLVDSKEPKPIIKKEKEMSKIKDAITKEKPTTQEAKKGSSVDLMKREKELLNRRDELNRMLEEAETKLTDVRENLESKGWIQSADGWIID
jgi:hypothetical protein